MDIQIEILPFDSPLQKESVILRDRILRKPLGLEYSVVELANEVDQIHLGAIYNEKVIGVLLLVPLEVQSLKMRQFAVDIFFQRKGIGRKLVLFAEDWARKNYFRYIILHAREIAIEFYLQMGYSLEGEEFSEVGIPHRKMNKKL